MVHTTCPHMLPSLNKSRSSWDYLVGYSMFEGPILVETAGPMTMHCSLIVRRRELLIA